MKLLRILVALLLIVFMSGLSPVSAQCSICTRTAQQLGEKPAKGLNAGIIYLAITPLALIGIIGYRWYRKQNSPE